MKELLPPSSKINNIYYLKNFQKKRWGQNRKWTFLKMSKIEKPKILFKKTMKITFVTIMLSFPKNDQKKCEHIFFYIFRKKS